MSDTARKSKNLPVVIHAQYIRDLSFENPNAPATFRGMEGNPESDINVNLDVRKIEDGKSDNLYEVVLTLSATIKRGDLVIFIGELEYGTLTSLRDVPEEQHHPLLLIEVPKMAFPFARQILADLSQQAGYPPLLINPVDFYAMYVERFTPKGSGETEEESAEKQDNPSVTDKAAGTA